MKSLEKWKHVPSRTNGAATGSKSKNAAANKGIAYHKRVYGILRQQHIAAERSDLLLIEPWFQNQTTWKYRQPDAVIWDRDTNTAIVVEVKWNWKGGRDDKLLNIYLPLVQDAFRLECCWPLMITSNVRGLQHEALPWTPDFAALDTCLSWMPGDNTPVALLP